MTAFEPKIKDKPNSLKPLAVLPEYDEDGNIESYLHPYEFELNKFEVNPKDLQPVEPLNAMKIDDTPLDFINNKVNLKRLTDELSHELELAVDVEHHSYRTFQGITCLLQISTRTKDYIIDTIALRDELHVLNSVFTNPKIVKIFHGADLDIQWLQRDLALYIVNMFDTHQAAKRLGLARLSLAYLLKNYCQIELDKTFQLADWRIRPLPQELIEYARKDTHYLLFIFDMMRNELLKMSNGQPNILINVYQSSTEICKLVSKALCFLCFYSRKNQVLFVSFYFNSATSNLESKQILTWMCIVNQRKILTIVNCMPSKKYFCGVIRWHGTKMKVMVMFFPII